MKPDVSLITEPDRSTEVRAVSAAMRRQVLAEQDSICARSYCDAPAVDVDHIQPLWLLGKNDRANLEGLCTDCHAQKTKAEAKVRGKTKRRAGETGQNRKRKQIQSAGFDKSKTKGFDGKVRPRNLRSALSGEGA